MKRILLFLLLTYNIIALAQVPNSFSYRATIYGKDSIPVINQQISVDIQIVNGDTDGSVEYAEKQEVITNSRGNFHIQIGAGQKEKEFKDLSDVTWGENDKFLIVKVFDENGIILSNGFTKLMSVPYALVAGRSLENKDKSTIAEYNNINLLRTTGGTPATGTIAYVKGHTLMNDNGGGYFFYDAGYSKSDDNGMVIDPHNPVGPKGRWRRHNYREVSINFFGALANDLSNDTQAIQNAIDFVSNSATNGGTVLFPAGNYFVDQIILRNGVSLQGEFKGTVIFASSQASGTLIRLDYTDGPVSNISIDGFMFQGNGYDIHCFEINSTISPNGGGLWKSNFKNIQINGFGKDSFRFQGPLQWNTDDVNQFIELENVTAIRESNPDSHALYMHGQNGQFSFTNCTFSGKKYEDPLPSGNNIEIHGVSMNQSGPFSSVINFNTCTVEEADLGILIDHTLVVNIYGCWFENLHNGISCVNEAKSIDISNSQFSNVSGDTGEYILKLNQESKATFTKNLLLGSYSWPHYSSLNNSQYFGLFNCRHTVGMDCDSFN